MAYQSAVHKFTTSLYVVDYLTGESRDYSKKLLAMGIRNDFVNNAFQQYKLIIGVDYEQERYLASNNFYLILKISRIDSNAESGEEENANDPIIDKDLFTIVLRPLNNSNSFKKTRITETDAESQDVLDSIKTKVTLECMPKEQLQINNAIINDCYTNCNMMEILINSISSVYTKSLRMTESYNTERYKDVLLPPQGIIPTLRYLQENYGIYKTNLNIFFTPDTLYIYDMFDDDLTKSNILNIEISQQDDTGQEKYTYVQVDENDNLLRTVSNNLVLLSNKDTINYSLGDQIVYTSYGDDFSLISRTTNAETEMKGDDRKTRYIWNSHQFEDFEYRATKTIYYSTIVSLSNIDFSLITPLTKIQISGSTNENENGVYSIIAMEVYLSTNDKKKYNDEIVLTLGKIK